MFAWPDAALLNLRMASLVKLWLWASPGVFFSRNIRGATTFRGSRGTTAHAVACVTFIGYCFVRFDQGHGWGYRYFHSATGCIPILAGIMMAEEKSVAAQRLIAFIGATAVLSLLVIIPLQLQQIDTIIVNQLAQLPPPVTPGRNVFFIKPLAGFYMADLIQIDPLLRGNDLLLATRGAPLDGQLIRQNWPDAREVASGPWVGNGISLRRGRGDPKGQDLPFSRLRFGSQGAR